MKRETKELSCVRTRARSYMQARRGETYLQVRYNNLLHRSPVRAHFSSKAVLKDDVRQSKNDAEPNTNNSDPANLVRPALGAATTRTREEAVAVLVVAIAFPADHAAVAFGGRALYGQSTDCRLDARFTVGALVERCGEHDGAIRDRSKPVVIEDLREEGVRGEERGEREFEKKGGKEPRKMSVTAGGRKEAQLTLFSCVPGVRNPRTELREAGSECTHLRERRERDTTRLHS